MVESSDSACCERMAPPRAKRLKVTVFAFVSRQLGTSAAESFKVELGNHQQIREESALEFSKKCNSFPSQ